MTKQLLFNLPLLFLKTGQVVEFEGIMTTDRVTRWQHSVKTSRDRWAGPVMAQKGNVFGFIYFSRLP
jgi:hypothetical protein